MPDFLARFAHNTPLLVEPSSAPLVAAKLSALNSLPEAVQAELTTMGPNDDFFMPNGNPSRFRPYNVRSGVLYIPVKGVLMHDFPYQFGSMGTGYEYVWAAFSVGMNDPNVKGIALLVDSPGGEVAGNFDLVDRMYALRGQKPVISVVSDHAYSAAYSIASVADRITVPKTGGVGSIGVVTMHIDQSARLEQEGLKVTFIYAGKHKVDGNSAEPLSPEVKKRVQERIDSVYEVFVSAVSRNRGLDSHEVRGTEARTYISDKAIMAGLADEIGAMEEVISAFSSKVNLEGDRIMTGKTDDKTPLTFSQADLDAARAEGFAGGKAEGLKEGEIAARERIEAILNSDEAKDRPAFARHVALSTAWPAADAIAALKVAAVETPSVPSSVKKEGAQESAFERAMQATGNPEIVAGSGSTETSVADRILANAGYGATAYAGRAN